MRSFDLIIVGAGASGLAAAINAKRHAPRLSVALIERLARAGKKILATGNGRCNLSNANAQEHPYRNREFAHNVMGRYDVERTLAFFKSIGLLTVTDREGRIYPMSNTAASVLDVLRFEALRCGAQLFCGLHCLSIERKADTFLINGEFSCRRLLIAAGGQASPVHGSDGSGYGLLRALGHSITPLYPSLVQLISPDKPVRALRGIRVHDAVINAADSRARGELLFTDYGLSGIAAMEVSAAVARKCAAGAGVRASLDLAPSLSREELTSFIAALPLCGEGALCGILPKAVGAAVLKRAGLDGADKTGEAAARAVAGEIKCFDINLSGTRGFEYAQVVSGGADVGEFDRATLESKKVRGLWCAGEILDVDGGCGGFNLQWAWSSGLLAGEMTASAG